MIAFIVVLVLGVAGITFTVTAVASEPETSYRKSDVFFIMGFTALSVGFIVAGIIGILVNL